MNPTRQVAPGEPINVIGPPAKYVGRGGFKLEAALGHFAIDVTGLRAIDVGASTGGFTDCLLQRGAASVVALDVGHGQLHEKMRADGRVKVFERTNIRDATQDSLDEQPFDIAVVDVSFISLRTVAPAIVGLLKPGGDLVSLIKPQFEAGRSIVSKGKGVIRDREIWEDVVSEVVAALSELKAATIGVMVSPVVGSEGNVEFLALFRTETGRKETGRTGTTATGMPVDTGIFDQAEVLSAGGN